MTKQEKYSRNTTPPSAGYVYCPYLPPSVFCSKCLKNCKTCGFHPAFQEQRKKESIEQTQLKKETELSCKTKGFFKNLSKKKEPEPNKDFDCLKLAQELLNNFQIADFELDPFLCRARHALVNSIVFYFCSDHIPEDWEFMRIMNLLKNAKREAEFGYYESSLKWLFVKSEDDDKPQHMGQRELEMFLLSASRTRPMTIDNILQTFKTPANFKHLLSIAKQKMNEPRAHVVKYPDYHYELRCMEAFLELRNLDDVIQFVNTGSYDNVQMDIKILKPNANDDSIKKAKEKAENFKYNGYCVERL